MHNVFFFFSANKALSLLSAVPLASPLIHKSALFPFCSPLHHFFCSSAYFLSLCRTCLHSFKLLLTWKNPNLFFARLCFFQYCPFCVAHIPSPLFISKITGLTTCNNIWMSPPPGSQQTLLSLHSTKIILLSVSKGTCQNFKSILSLFSPWLVSQLRHFQSSSFGSPVIPWLTWFFPLMILFLPFPSLCVQVLMRIIHWLSITHLLWASQFLSPLPREHKQRRRNLIHSHKQITASLHRQKSFCTLDLLQVQVPFNTCKQHQEVRVWLYNNRKECDIHRREHITSLKSTTNMPNAYYWPYS